MFHFMTNVIFFCICKLIIVFFFFKLCLLFLTLTGCPKQRPQHREFLVYQGNIAPKSIGLAT